MAIKLTKAQAEILKRINVHINSGGTAIAYCYWGHLGSINGLIKRGLLKSINSNYTITDLGKKVLSELT